MEKLDHRKLLKSLYSPPAKRVVDVAVPPLRFLMIDGASAPGSPEFSNAVAALYPLAYTIKFMIKRGPLNVDFRVLPLEGLWWAEDMSAFTESRRDEWQWTLMIMQPPLVDRDMVETARAEVERKKGPAALPGIRFEEFDEGECAQILHKGSFDAEGPTVEKLHAYIEGLGKRPVGKHHEIYLSDMRRTAPDSLKTIIRQPMQ